jgi:hypothetical protein
MHCGGKEPANLVVYIQYNCRIYFSCPWNPQYFVDFYAFNCEEINNQAYFVNTNTGSPRFMNEKSIQNRSLPENLFKDK